MSYDVLRMRSECIIHINPINDILQHGALLLKAGVTLYGVEAKSAYIRTRCVKIIRQLKRRHITVHMGDMDYGKFETFRPDSLDYCAAEWEDYKRAFLIHLDAKGLYDATGRRKVGQLLKCMGKAHIATYDTFTWDPEVPAVEADADRGI